MRRRRTDTQGQLRESFMSSTTSLILLFIVARWRGFQPEENVNPLRGIFRLELVRPMKVHVDDYSLHFYASCRNK